MTWADQNIIGPLWVALTLACPVLFFTNPFRPIGGIACGIIAYLFWTFGSFHS